MLLPIGVIPISTPIRNIVNPIIRNTAPIKNLTIVGLSRGVSVKLSINTMIVIGIIDDKTSLNFAINTLK
jgi:hypothetical protein